MPRLGDIRPAVERVLAQVCVDDNGCWLWQGYLGRERYGQITVPRPGSTKRTSQKTHRVTYEHMVGALPDGSELDHLCRVRHCCNPDHLEAVTHQENVNRGQARRGLRRRTHCSHGHELTPDNSYIHPRSNFRGCRTCRQDRRREHNQRRRALAEAEAGR